MKVIEDNYTLKTWSKTCNCSSCKSKVELEIGDIRYISDQRDGDYYSWTCPLCACGNGVSAGLWPELNGKRVRTS